MNGPALPPQTSRSSYASLSADVQSKGQSFVDKWAKTGRAGGPKNYVSRDIADKKTSEASKTLANSAEHFQVKQQKKHIMRHQGSDTTPTLKRMRSATKSILSSNPEISVPLHHSPSKSNNANDSEEVKNEPEDGSLLEYADYVGNDSFNELSDANLSDNEQIISNDSNPPLIHPNNQSTVIIIEEKKESKSVQNGRNHLSAEQRAVLEQFEQSTPKNDGVSSSAKVQSTSNRIKDPKLQQPDTIKVDVSGLDMKERMRVRASRALNFMRLGKGAINSSTIMMGASKSWDAKRLKEGKHQHLRAMGAEHVQLTSSTGCKVDAHYLDASEFIKKLEDLGGQRTLCEYTPPPALRGKEYTCHVNGKPVVLREIPLDPSEIKKNDISLRVQLTQAVGHTVKILPGPGGKFYMTSESSEKVLKESGLITDGEITENVDLQEVPTEESQQHEKMSFPTIEFPGDKALEAKALLDSLQVKKSPWELANTGKTFTLVQKEHRDKLDLCLQNQAQGKEFKTPVNTPVESQERGTVLLSMPQLGIYEQYTHEILTFALQGVNVMAYNNPGKGLSTGGADRENIDASIEASYRFLKSEKNMPDEKILAKGLCFGSAPTAWLGKEHPNINLMMDQSPANFHEIAVDMANEKLNALPGEKNELVKWMKKSLTDNFIITGVAKAVLGGYNIAEDLSHNQGHKLFNTAVKNEEGKGGDELVFEHHLDKILDGIDKNSDKELSLSQNPGAEHGDDWWTSSQAKNNVYQFLDKTGISQSIF